MAQQKQGKKGRKYGRNSRAPSAKLQAQRTAKNKRIAIEKAMAKNPKSVGHICPRKVVHDSRTGEKIKINIGSSVDFSLRARALLVA